MPTQHANPNNKGFAPVLISLTMLVFKPMALMARIMRNLLKSLRGVNTSPDTPADTAAVVITEASIK